MIRPCRPKVGRTAMADRRRAARLIVLVVAGLAVAGTSPAMPTPGPTQRIDLTGAVHVTAAQPVAIQPITVDMEVGESASLSFAATVARQPADGHVIVSI